LGRSPAVEVYTRPLTSLILIEGHPNLHRTAQLGLLHRPAQPADLLPLLPLTSTWVPRVSRGRLFPFLPRDARGMATGVAAHRAPGLTHGAAPFVALAAADGSHAPRFASRPPVLTLTLGCLPLSHAAPHPPLSAAAQGKTPILCCCA
jgi:hypothetical protein